MVKAEVCKTSIAGSTPAAAFNGKNSKLFYLSNFFMSKKNLNIVSISSEIDPYSKTGGLADVARSLPRALNSASAL